MTFKSGFVAILGRPNVGKSTFLNHVMGQKIAIMSDKAQTTRNKIMGIYTTPAGLCRYPGYSQAQDSTWRFHGGICLFNPS